MPTQHMETSLTCRMIKQADKLEATYNCAPVIDIKITLVLFELNVLCFQYVDWVIYLGTL